MRGRKKKVSTRSASLASSIATLTGMGTNVAATIYNDVLVRKEEIDARLNVIGIKGGTRPTDAKMGSATSVERSFGSKLKSCFDCGINDMDKADDNVHSRLPPVPSVIKTDTHWDFAMKEMMWLAADFQSERKRQLSLGKKISSAVRQFHNTKEARRVRDLAEAEVKRRRLAGRIGREVKGWWTKIERVIAHKQRLDVDAERRKMMDKQLVGLVKLTERYGKSLARKAEKDEYQSSSEDDGEDNDNGDESRNNSMGGSDHDRNARYSSRRRRRRKKRMTIEVALSAGNKPARRAKSQNVDYKRIAKHRGDDDDKFYGESTVSDTGSDATFVDDSDYDDDETTLLEAEVQETTEQMRRQHLQSNYHHNENSINFHEKKSYIADPRELIKLQEESQMNINDVIERLKQEACNVTNGTENNIKKDKNAAFKKTVTFAVRNKYVRMSENSPSLYGEHKHCNGAATNATTAPNLHPYNDPRNDADDHADVSDVEDFVKRDGMSHGPEEFEADENVVDDERTMEAEEKLGREISAEEEISLRKKENEMSNEELGKLYSAVDSGDEQAEHVSFIEEKETMEQSSKNEQKLCITGNKYVESNNVKSRNEKSTPLYLEPLAGDDTREDDEFKPSALVEVDDETTIEAEERLGRDMSHEEEIAMLENERKIPIDKLKEMYRNMDAEDLKEWEESFDRYNCDDFDSKAGAISGFQSTLTRCLVVNASFSTDDNDEFQPDDTELIDDETTLDVEEKLSRDMSYEDEISLLKKESEMSVQDLRNMYAGIPADGSDEDSVDSIGGTSDTANEEGNEEGTQKKSLAQLSSILDQDDHDEKDEYTPNLDAIDGATTLIEEEMCDHQLSSQGEIALLEQEREVPKEKHHEIYHTMGNDADPNQFSRQKRLQVENEEDKHDEEKDLDQQSQEVIKRRRLSYKKLEGVDSNNDGLSALQTLHAVEEKARKTLASRPFLLASWVKLREYQQIGLNWLVSIQTRRLNGILADEMGLGKTLQTISLIGYLAAYKGIWGPHLIIVPTSCIVNWETEFKRFCPGLKVLCYYGSAKRRKELRTGWTKANWHHVIITSYQLAVQDSFAFKRKKWYYMVLDEAQNIKNFQSQRWQTLITFNSQRRLLLTGTPLQNNLMELWSLMHFLMPHVFRSRREFSYWFSNPMNNMIEGTSERNEELITRLHGIIRPFILRRLKKDVETQMPGKFEHIVKCHLSRRQMFLYEEFMARASTRQSLKKGGNYMGMMNVLMQLRKVCNHPDLFEPRSIITPFVHETLTLRAASCVVDVMEPRSPLDTVGGYLLYPLWCGSVGIPSFSLRIGHNEIRASQFGRLETSISVHHDSVLGSDVKEPMSDDMSDLYLAQTLTKIWRKTKKEREEIADFQARMNTMRRQSRPFPYSNRLLEVFTFDDHPLGHDEPEVVRGTKVISTPLELIALQKSQQQRADKMDDIISKFVFCVPKSGACRPKLDAGKGVFSAHNAAKSVTIMLNEPLEQLSAPFRKASARLSSFFPDKKLVQFDAGKLQALSRLLKELKRGSHRALIFTQMSKMLDILEAFLNLNGLTYLRLDGGTGVDKRQRLMDRFNNDTKIFCFILSTRSGGLGINLTGADTVIFYDTDWNPAMDAQAQDRAHRIGQTRDVHIYRLVTAHTVEENILTKAKQKRNLDLLVMDEGKFDASQLQREDNVGKESNPDCGNSQDLFTKGGLRDIFGVEQGAVDTRSPENTADERCIDAKSRSQSEVSKEHMERAMASLEDEDDVLAMHGAQKEAAEALKEFDESIELKKETEGGNSNDEDEAVEKNKTSINKKGKIEKEASTEQNQPDSAKLAEQEMQNEFAAWQSEVGTDISAIEATLSRAESYGLHFREDIAPYWSVYAINEYNRKMESSSPEENEVDVDAIQDEKAAQERRAIEEGDLLVTQPPPEVLQRQRHLYVREKARLRSNRKRQKLTGENWTSKIDALSKKPFWYNEDTGEAIWDKPKVLTELDAEETARHNLWNKLPLKPLLLVMECLIPFPERMNCAVVCRHWRVAATDISFVRHVLPVERGAAKIGDSQLDKNHFWTIADAIAVALPGDMIELGDGHYWIDEPGIQVDVPLRLVGDEHDPSHVIIELSGSVIWRSGGGWIEGITFRRPRISSRKNDTSREILRVEKGGKVDMVHSVMNNQGYESCVAVVEGSNLNCRWNGVEIKGGGGKHGGLLIDFGGNIELEECVIRDNDGDGLSCQNTSFFKMTKCKVERNSGYGVKLGGKSQGQLIKCNFDQKGNIIQKESGCSCAPCIENTAAVTFCSDLKEQMPSSFPLGFKPVEVS